MACRSPVVERTLYALAVQKRHCGKCIIFLLRAPTLWSHKPLSWRFSEVLKLPGWVFAPPYRRIDLRTRQPNPGVMRAQSTSPIDGLTADQDHGYVALIDQTAPLRVDPFGFQPLTVAAAFNFHLLIEPHARSSPIKALNSMANFRLLRACYSGGRVSMHEYRGGRPFQCSSVSRSKSKPLTF